MIEPEILQGRRAYATAQSLFTGPTILRLPLVKTCGWYGTSVEREDGSFAVVRVGLEDMIGDIVKVEFRGRSVFAYVIGARDVPVDIALSRGLFQHLGPLWAESIRLSRVDLVG